jgi:hypothetical protein
MKTYGSIIESANYQKQQRIHYRLKKQNAAIDKQAEAWRESFGLDNPTLLVRMNEDSEGIPAGIPIEVPNEYSNALIRVRASTPVGDFKTIPVLVVSEDEL